MHKYFIGLAIGVPLLIIFWIGAAKVIKFLFKN
jgi:hypothetical protein